MRLASSGTGWVVKGLLTLGVLAVLALTLDSLAFSDASFTAGSSSVATITAGDLRHVNDHDGRLLIEASGLVPGDVRSGTMSLTGLGDLAGRYTLSAAGLAEQPGSPRLSDTLALAISDQAAGTTLYEGPVSGFSSVDLGTIGPGDSRSYSVVLSYPEGDDDSRLQGAAMTLSLRIAGVTS
jgi:hypothetical protein